MAKNELDTILRLSASRRAQALAAMSDEQMIWLADRRRIKRLHSRKAALAVINDLVRMAAWAACPQGSSNEPTTSGG